MRLMFRSSQTACALACVLLLIFAEPALAANGIAGFLRENMAPIMFAALVGFLLLGYPVAFALAANGLVFALVGIELGLFQENFLQVIEHSKYGLPCLKGLKLYIHL